MVKPWWIISIKYRVWSLFTTIQGVIMLLMREFRSFYTSNSHSYKIIDFNIYRVWDEIVSCNGSFDHSKHAYKTEVQKLHRPVRMGSIKKEVWALRKNPHSLIVPCTETTCINEEQGCIWLPNTMFPQARILLFTKVVDDFPYIGGIVARSRFSSDVNS